MHRSRKDLLYVLLQLVLFSMYFLVPPKFEWHVHAWLKVLAAILAAAGIVICTISVLQLKNNLTPFPSPVRGGHLITSGMFKYARHPIYSGLILFFMAFALYSGNWGRLLVALLLLLLFYFKSRYEERRLEQSYSDYPLYKKRTGRFLPRLRVRV